MIEDLQLYEDKRQDEWNGFIEFSMNEIFLQSRSFLYYHPKDSFKDASLMCYNEKNHLIAVSPACEIENDNKRIFYSHKESAYGGILLSSEVYKAKHIMPLWGGALKII